jgi:flagellar motor switch protein FliN/FliY
LEEELEMASDTNMTDTGGADKPAAEPNQTYAPDELNKGVNAPGQSGTKGGAVATTGKTADVNLELVLDVPVNLSLQVGSTVMTIRELVKLVEGSVISLDRESTEPMDVLVNGTLIAHGEIVLVDDSFGVRLTDVVSPIERIEKLN